MSQGADWRKSEDYDYVERLDAGDLAWEFLRRNTAYRRDYQRTAKHNRDGAADAFSLRWGLRFPDRPNPFRAGYRHLLDTQNRSRDRNRRARAASTRTGRPATYH